VRSMPLPPDLPLELAYWPADTGRPVLETTPGDVLRRAAAAVPQRVALAEIAPPGASLSGADRTDRTWTYAQLLADAERAASWLSARFTPGEHLAVWAPNIPEWVVLQYGAALAGLVLVTVNPAMREAELRHVLSQSGAVGLVLTDSFRGTEMAAMADRLRPHLPRLRETVSFTGWLAQVRRTPRGSLPRVDAAGPAQIQYTSGTTGAPKGAILHHRGLVTNAAFVAARAGFPDGGTWASALPLFHTAGCGLTVLGTALGEGTLVLPQFFHPELMLEAMQNWRADLFAGVPVMHAALLAHPGFDAYDLGACSVLMSGGDTVPPALIEEAERRFGARFCTVYGQTELSPIIAQTSPHDSPDDKRHTTGRPLWQVEVKVIDPGRGDVRPIGEPGEICARVPGDARLPRPPRSHRPGHRPRRLAAHRRPGRHGRARPPQHHRPSQRHDHPRRGEHLPHRNRGRADRPSPRPPSRRARRPRPPLGRTGRRRRPTHRPR
jgi:acyl-CoA synthetase (AMP-forming)/AMP-acid ligase II